MDERIHVININIGNKESECLTLKDGLKIFYNGAGIQTTNIIYFSLKPSVNKC